MQAVRSTSVRPQRLLVVVPAFNEAGRIGDVVRDVRTTLPSAHVLVVDDGSEDRTADEAADAGAAVLTLPVNSGYGAALQTGYKYAVRCHRRRGRRHRVALPRP